MKRLDTKGVPPLRLPDPFLAIKSFDSAIYILIS